MMAVDAERSRARLDPSSFPTRAPLVHFIKTGGCAMIHHHEHVLDRVNAYVERTLSRTDAAAVKQHCARCAFCRATLEVLAAERWTALRKGWGGGLGLSRTPSRFSPRPPSRGSQIGKFFWSTLAVAAVVLAGFHFGYASLKPSPYDLRVLGQTEWLPATDAALHLRILQHGGGRAPHGVPITIELTGPAPGQEVRLASVTTGDHGAAAPRFRLPDWPDGDYTLKITATAGRTREQVSRTVSLKRSWRLMVSTDKPVYQPGQVIRARGLALRRPDLKPVAGQEMVFTVTDPRGNVIFRHRGATSRFGIGSAACSLAGELNEGNYQVECRVGATASSATVEVKSYVVPRFRVALALDQPYYQPGQLLKGQVQADYVFGKPVAGGSATINLETTEITPTRCDAIELHTDAAGAAVFELRLPEVLVGREQNSDSARIAVTATVRDPAGQTQARTETRVVAAQPIRIEVIPDAGTLVKDVPNTIHVMTSTPDGQPAPTRLNITGLDPGQPAGKLLRTSPLGLASFELTPRTGAVSWMLQAQDDCGRTGRRHVTLTCGTLPGDFLVRTDKAVYRGGETIRLLTLGAGVEPVFLDLVKDGQTVLCETIDMNDGRGERALDLPPEMFGTVVLHSYRYGPEGLPVQKSRVIQIQPANGLTIKTVLDRPEYLPGERAALTLALTDDHGKPAVGAISLAAVDEAVFGVLDRRPGLERTFFTLEQELLKPVYEIKDWSAVQLDLDSPSARSADRVRFEQAVFARTNRRVDEQIQRIRSTLASDPEIGDGTLGVLERPDWEQLASSIGMSADQIAQLRKTTGTHSLVVSSYPEKLRKVESIQRAAFGTIATGWIFLGLAALAGGLVGLIRSVQHGVELLVVVSILGVLVGLMLPAVQSARESARRAQGINELKQIGLAVANATRAPGGFAAGGSEAVRVRQHFPETLLWQPELITDDQGRAALDIDLADSITTWRVSLGAISADGRLGGAQARIRVFQPFFVDLDLPLALTRGDEVAVPVVVSNYLDKPQTVALSLQHAPWFEELEGDKRSVSLSPNEVRAAHFRLRVKSVGRHELQITARGSERGVADAVRRPIEVVPDGCRVEQVSSGTLQQQRPVELTLSTPEQAIPGSVKAIVKIYPSSFSEVVEGLDAIFERPYGCFEQTSSITYPSVLALDYLRRIKKSAPEVEAKARQYIHLGYQRLLSFEVRGGGFEWFGSSPANHTLTAYGLMEFQDMARVHDVDPNLIARTRRWLLDQQRPDGSWDPEGHSFLGNPAERSRNQDLARVSTTAYIASSVFSGWAAVPEARATFAYLQSQDITATDDPYVLALVAHGLLAIDPEGTAARLYLDRIESLKRTSTDGKLVWWEPPDSRSNRSLFFGGGETRDIETTALAALALLNSGRSPSIVRSALAWLVAHKDTHGTWGSTQATVLALKALVAGTGKPLGGDKPRQIAIVLDGAAVSQLAIPADQADVMRQFDLSERFARGTQRLSIVDRSGMDSGYQIVFSYHESGAVDLAASASKAGPLTIRLDYDRTCLAVDETVTATATVANNRQEPAPMVILDLPIPAGFTLDTDDLAGMVKTGAVAKVQLTSRTAIIYVRGLDPGVPLTLRYRLRAGMPVKLTVPPARVYEYYDPARQGSSPVARLTVVAKS
jgi:hypothetical protein